MLQGNQKQHKTNNKTPCNLNKHLTRMLQILINTPI